MSSVTHNLRSMLVVAAGAAAPGCDDDTSIAVDANLAPCMDPRHDEDGDGVGDGCDVCPTVADAAQLDAGEQRTNAFPDGVGDACDPRPSIAGDTRVALHTFAGADDRLRSDGWTIADDVATAPVAARMESVRRFAGDGLVAEVRLAAFAGTVRIVLDGDGLSTGVGCTFARDRDADGFDEVDLFELGGTAVTMQLGRALQTPIIVTAFRSIGVDRAAAILCRVRPAEPGSGEDPVEHRMPLSDDSSTGNYVVEASVTPESPVVASSVVVYTTPVAPPQDEPL